MSAVGFQRIESRCGRILVQACEPVSSTMANLVGLGWPGPAQPSQPKLTRLAALGPPTWLASARPTEGKQLVHPTPVNPPTHPTLASLPPTHSLNLTSASDPPHSTYWVPRAQPRVHRHQHSTNHETRLRCGSHEPRSLSWESVRLKIRKSPVRPRVSAHDLCSLDDDQL